MAAAPRAPRGSIWRTAKAVAWSFFGVRQNRASQEDMARLNPVHVVGVALVAVVLFVGALVGLVHWIAG